MSTVGQVYYNVIDNNSGKYISSGIDIFQDIVSSYTGKTGSVFSKLGVQATPGTQVVFNENKTIMIGRTGIYELDDSISIGSMRFVKPRKYQLDQALTDEALEQGTEGMIAADTKRKEDLEAFHEKWPDGAPSKETDPAQYTQYWEEYNGIQSDYIAAYQEALNLYNQGVNGIYVLPDPENPDSALNYSDLYNVIVDFIYD